MSSARSSENQKSGVAFLLTQVGAHAAFQFAERLETLKLDPAHAGILRAINAENGLSQRELAKLMGMFPSRLVLVLDELEKAGLIERKASAEDRRTHMLHLTARGKETLQNIGRIAREHQDAFCAALNASERETLAALLSKLAAHHHLTPGVHPGYRKL
ncbi:MarR family winged helix-turn-helix transcriptional regulator [Pedosphaera parvula]|uniref:Transcriptional regulator, MarR family n=1 Tax=Pedosphaera parvula (strain Ellin514) TaxID=320771 RepID=B9XP02_PEDPL|nr:MarR family transcriptional regulator [Pedosphaera parvula]EEF58468.1 transcriptional regulator, MarR family [Pedosphaera parvula Ellin514]